MSLIKTHFKELDCLQEININDVNHLAYLIKNTEGNIFFVGVGKNSSIAKHIADTLKSISIRSFYFSPLNCTHGDIGALKSNDLIIYLSKSGNTEELVKIIPQIKNKNIKSVLVSCNLISLISKQVDYSIYLKFSKETTFMIPTVSIILFIFFFNLVINVLVYEKKLSIDDYALNHKSGNIGFLLNNKISDIMQTKNLPIIDQNLKIIDVIFRMTQNKFPVIFYLNNKKIIGIFTDGDLRRCIIEDRQNLDLNLDTFVNKNFYSLNQNLKLSELNIDYLIKNKLLSGVPILNDDQELVGQINKEILITNNFTL
jgi:arabinose-5-phosphate isomerase